MIPLKPTILELNLRSKQDFSFGKTFNKRFCFL